MSDSKNELSEQEADLYDRQIRLWGIESQKKLRAANVLLIGVRALGAEIAKNILLSGIKSLTFLDDGKVTEDDLSTNFLIPSDALGQNIAESVIERAKNLNPMVQIVADTSSVKDKDESFYKSFTIIVATLLPPKELISINQICRSNEIQFVCGDVFGMFGYTFLDLQMHEYYEDVKKFVVAKKRKHTGKPEKTEPTIVRTIKKSIFSPLQDALGFDWTIDDQKKVEKFSSFYFLTRVLLKFRDVYGRNPSADELESDQEKLIEIKHKLFDSLGVNYDKLDGVLFGEIFGEVVPVCAIIGGILAQEVIKAVSHNEAPLNNMFFFDPEKMSGKVECIGNE